MEPELKPVSQLKPASHFFKTTIIFILVLILIFAGYVFYEYGGLYWLSKITARQSSNSEQIPFATSTASLDTPEVQAKIKDAMLSTAKLQFASTSSETLINTLPSDLVLMETIASSTGNIKIQSVKYVDGKSGFDITFNSSTPLDVIQRNYGITLGPDIGWTRLFSAKSNSFGIVEAQSKDYKVRVSVDLVESDQSSDVHIQVSSI